MLISQVPISEEISIAPGKRKKPSSILYVKYYEELGFLQFFQMASLSIELSEKLNQVL